MKPKRTRLPPSVARREAAKPVPCTCAIPTLVQARAHHARVGLTHIPELWVSLERKCSTHGQAAMPLVWAHSPPDVTGHAMSTLAWYGHAALATSRKLCVRCGQECLPNGECYCGATPAGVARGPAVCTCPKYCDVHAPDGPGAEVDFGRKCPS